MTERPPPETVHVPDGPVDPSKIAATPVDASDVASASAQASGLPKFGRFQTTAQLGAGAMGTVYRAHDDMLGRDVAIKSLTADDGLGTRERFLREARAIGALQHAHILGIYDAGTEGTTPYLVMELASAGTLRDHMRLDGAAVTPLSIETARAVGIQIARALAAAHAANIVHRDVKPANILATRDASGSEIWKLADFGIARLPDSTLTVTGQFIGSPSYAAPESLREGKFGPACDVYALAATLYEALTGTPPHGDHDMRSVIRKLEEDPPPLQIRRADVPGSIGVAIMAGLARDPAQRPSAERFARMLAGEASASAIGVGVPSGIGAPSAVGVAGGPAASSSTMAGLGVVPASSATTPASSNRTKLAAILLAVAAAGVVIFAITRRSSSLPDPRRADQPTPVETRPDDPRDEARPDDESPQPVFVDQNGNPVDDETAKQLLEQMQRDAEDQLDRPGPGRGHKKGKHKPFE